jgi:hypothetical protein
MQLQNTSALGGRNSILRLEMCDLIHVDHFVREAFLRSNP